MTTTNLKGAAMSMKRKTALVPSNNVAKVRTMEAAVLKGTAATRKIAGMSKVARWG